MRREGQVAAELKITPNAVSALMRRARSGLRVSWLAQHVPSNLSQDSSHAAALLPAYVVSKRSDDARDRRQVESHLGVCVKCTELDAELRALSGRMRGTTLGIVGFAALAGILPASTTGTVGTAAFTIGGFSLGTAIAASIGTIAAGTGLTAALLLGGSVPHTESAKPDSPVITSQSRGDDDSTSSNSGSSHSPDDTAVTGPDSGAVGVTLGRGVSDPTIPAASFGANGPASPYVSPPRYDNVPPGSLLPPSEGINPPLKLGMNLPTATTGFGASYRRVHHTTTNTGWYFCYQLA